MSKHLIQTAAAEEASAWEIYKKAKGMGYLKVAIFSKRRAVRRTGFV